MKTFINSIKNSDKRFAILTSAAITILIFSVFFGQVLLSDVLTFQKNGDQLKLCFPDLLKLGTYRSWMGVDTGSFNGSTEFFLRANVPNFYLPAILSSLAMKFFYPRFIYILFYMVHMYIGLYYAQRTASKFFSLNRYFSLLVACSFLTVLLSSVWYLSFYIITSLTFVVLYFGLSALEDGKKRFWLLYALPYVFAFTSGYMTLSLVLVCFTTLTVFIYGYNYKNDVSKRALLLRTIIPPFIAGLVNLIYYVQVLLYTHSWVKNGSPTLFDALYYKLDIRNIPLIVSSAFSPVSPIEQFWLLSIGFVWAVVVTLFIKQAIIKSMDQQNKNFFIYAVTTNVLLVIIAFGTETPLAFWFYSFFPVIGAMHLPTRYLMITLPLLYLTLCLGVQYLPDGKGQKLFWILCSWFVVLAFLISIYSAHYDIMYFNANNMILQLLLAAAVFYSIFHTGLASRVTIIAWCISVVLIGLVSFYNSNEVAVPKSVISERSIVYNESYQKKLDGFIGTLPARSLYKFIAYDSKEGVPDFLPGNYEWYGFSNYHLSNYLGYEIQLCVPQNYRNRFPWFNRVDWDYVLDTRGDFVVLDQKSIDENTELFNTIIDWEKSNVFIDNTHRMCKLKKFVPSHYTKEKYLLDDPYVLDNGYFYSHDLKNNMLTNFATDNATYFKASINASVSTDLSFLLYPNRYYKYYIDGKEITPTIDNAQAFLPLEKGQHVLSIEYKSPLSYISNIIYIVFYSLVLISFVVFWLGRERLKSKRI